MQTLKKRLFLILFLTCLLSIQIVASSFSEEKVIGRIKEIGIGRIILKSGVIVLTESNTVVEDEDGKIIPYSKLAVKDVIAVKGSGDKKAIRASKIKKMAH